MSTSAKNIQDLSSTLTLHVEADPSEMDKLIDAMEQGQRKLEQKATERASSSAFLPEILSPEHRLASIRAERQLERDLIADRVHGLDVVAAVEKTNHERRMRQIIDESRLEEDNLAMRGGGRSGTMSRLAGLNARDAAANRAASGARAGGLIQEFGRGFEDFVISASMGKTQAEGIALGLRGASNNVAQLASNFGPVVGASVAVGAALTAVILPSMINWISDTEAVKKRMADVEDSLKRQQTLIRENVEVWGRTDTFSGAKSELDRLETEREVLAQQITSLRNDLRGPQMLTDEGRARTKVLEDSLATRLKEQEENNTRLARAEGTLLVRSKEEKKRRELKAALETNKALEQAEKERLKQKEADEKAMSKKIEDQIKSDFDLRIANQEAAVDSLQERVSRAGNPNGPSAALIRGSSAAESAINRAVAGTASQENTLKASLKVQQDQLKELRKQKQTVVAGL